MSLGETWGSPWTGSLSFKTHNAATQMLEILNNHFHIQHVICKGY